MDQPSLRNRLMLEHEMIERALATLVDAYATGEHDVAREAFRSFDRRLAAHLSMEETVLLPDFAIAYPAEAAQIAREHGEIRALIDELGIGTDLHCTRLPAIRGLANQLRAHARHEDALFYRWANERAISHPTTRPPVAPRQTPPEGRS